jgi:hypothetical protein
VAIQIANGFVRRHLIPIAGLRTFATATWANRPIACGVAAEAALQALHCTSGKGRKRPLLIYSLRLASVMVAR